VAGDGREELLTQEVSVSLPEFPVGGPLLLEDGFSLLLEDGSGLLFSEFTTVDEFLALVDNSSLYETPFFLTQIAARTRTSVVPVVQGYRVDMTLLVRGEPFFAFVLETEGGTSIITEDGRLLEVIV
jgi:hypothetical protein